MLKSDHQIKELVRIKSRDVNHLFFLKMMRSIKLLKIDIHPVQIQRSCWITDIMSQEQVDTCIQSIDICNVILISREKLADCR